MNFIEDIIKNKERLVESEVLKEKRKNFYRNEFGGDYATRHTGSLNDFEVAFLDLLWDKLIDVYPVQRIDETVEAFREHYESSRIEMDHIYGMGFTFPTEDNDEWEMFFGISGGDAFVILEYKGWDFKHLIIN